MSSTIPRSPRSSTSSPIRIGWVIEMVRPAMALPSVLRAAKPTISPDSPAEASRPVEITRSAWNCESTAEMEVTQMAMCSSLRVSASCVAVSGSKVPRWRWRSRARLKPTLTTRDSTEATASSTIAVITCRGCTSTSRIAQNDGFEGAYASREESTARES